MHASNHAGRTAVKAAAGIGAVLALCEAAHLAAQARGVLAGAAVIAIAFVACWVVVQARQLLRHPAPVRRPSRGRDREMPAPLALADSREPARIAA